MKKSKILFGILGLVLGVLLSSFTGIFNNGNNLTYFELKEDVYIENIGNLKKGTLLRYDDSYPEGFTRFILYLNAKGIDLQESKQANENQIIPYWLEKQ